MDNRLRKSEILRRKRDFERVLFRGRRRRNGSVRLYYAPSEHGRRAAFITGGKFPSNVARNRIRRHLREIFRTNHDSFPDGFDFILRADAAALKMGFPILLETVLRLTAEVKPAS